MTVANSYSLKFLAVLPIKSYLIWKVKRNNEPAEAIVGTFYILVDIIKLNTT